MSSEIRQRVWHHLEDVASMATYTDECSRWVNRIGRGCSLLVAIITVIGIAYTWGKWDASPWLFATIVGGGQLFQLAWPYLPWLAIDKDLLEMSYKFRRLSLEFENAWFSWFVRERAAGTPLPVEAESEIRRLFEEELKIEEAYKHIHCPRWNWLDKRVDKMVDNALQRFR